MKDYSKFPSFVFGGYVVYLVDKSELSSSLVYSLEEYAFVLRQCYGDEISLKKFVAHVTIGLFLTVNVSLKLD